MSVSSAVLLPNFASGQTPTGAKKTSRHHPYPVQAPISANRGKAKAAFQDENTDMAVEFDMLFYPYLAVSHILSCLSQTTHQLHPLLVT
jgi:hypothetical protein